MTQLSNADPTAGCPGVKRKRVIKFPVSRKSKKALEFVDGFVSRRSPPRDNLSTTCRLSVIRHLFATVASRFVDDCRMTKPSTAFASGWEARACIIVCPNRFSDPARVRLPVWPPAVKRRALEQIPQRTSSRQESTLAGPTLQGDAAIVSRVPFQLEGYSGRSGRSFSESPPSRGPRSPCGPLPCGSLPCGPRGPPCLR